MIFIFGPKFTCYSYSSLVTINFALVQNKLNDKFDKTSTLKPDPARRRWYELFARVVTHFCSLLLTSLTTVKYLYTFNELVWSFVLHYRVPLMNIHFLVVVWCYICIILIHSHVNDTTEQDKWTHFAEKFIQFLRRNFKFFIKGRNFGLVQFGLEFGRLRKVWQGMGDSLMANVEC